MRYMLAEINVHCKHENVVWTDVTSNIINYNNKKTTKGIVRTKRKPKRHPKDDGLSDSAIPRAQSPRQSFPSQQSLAWLFVCFHTNASRNIMPTCLEKILSHTYGACL